MAALSLVMRTFILHWGEMGTRWGVNRTVAQIHALLYLSPKALTAEEIAKTLSVARSNVSTSLKELQAWGLVRAVHLFGDRRDHFESDRDVWEMFRKVIEGRKRREIDPTLALLRESVAQLSKVGPGEAYAKERLASMLDFFETMTQWYQQIREMPPKALLKFARLGGKVQKLLAAVV